MELVRVHNNKATFLGLPKVEGFPIKNLIPGGNNVAAEYIAALEALPTDKGPGKVWEAWKRNKYVEVISGPHAKGEIKKPEGPRAPEALDTISDKAAEAFVSMEQDTNVLQKWLGKEKRKGIREHINKKLGSDEGEEK